MKHGCMVMTLRISSSRRIGSRQIHCSRKNHVKFAAMPRPCWSFFFWHPRHCPQGIHTPWPNPQWQVLLWGFQSGWGREFCTNIQTSGRKTIDFSTMTTHPLTHHLSFDNSWLPKKLQWFPTPLFARPRPLWHFLFPKMKLWLKVRHIDMTEEIHAEMLGDIDTLTSRTSRDAWNHGKHAGIAVYMPKGTMETRSYNKKPYLWSYSRNFWVAPCI